MTNHSLLDALRIDTFNDRRKALRELATPALSMITSSDVREAFEDSRLVGDEMAQINPRPTVSGLRDSLDEDTLCALIDGRISDMDVIRAIEDPDGHGETSAASKTGYVFGRPKGLPHGQREILLKSTPTAKETPMSYNIADFGLQDYIDIFDHCVDAGYDGDDVLEAMETALGAPAETINGMQALVHARTEKPIDKTVLSSSIQKAADDVVRELEQDGE